MCVHVCVRPASHTPPPRSANTSRPVVFDL